MSEESDEPLAQARVSAWLRSHGDVTIPPEVADRLQQSLAAESRRRAVAPVVDLETRRGPGTEPGPVATRPHRGRWLLAASVAALAALGALIVPPLLDGGSDLLAGGADDSAATTSDSAEMEAQSLPEQAGDLDERAGIDALPPVPAEVADLVLGISSAAPAGSSCGVTLAAEVDGTVLASAEAPATTRGVVLLIDEGGTAAVWWLPSCDSGPDQALGRSPGMPPP
ncbi:MAG: hypothetical protein WCA29_07035 [Jiangellales bacterium]